MKTPILNFNKPILELRHADLDRFGDGPFKRQCPVCKDGLLAVRRDAATMELLGDDNCFGCGQQVRYTDIEELRKKVGE